MIHCFHCIRIKEYGLRYSYYFPESSGLFLRKYSDLGILTMLIEFGGLKLRQYLDWLCLRCIKCSEMMMMIAKENGQIFLMSSHKERNKLLSSGA